MIEIVSKGGPIMWPLLAISVLSLTVSIERFFYLIKFKFSRDYFQEERFLKLLSNAKLNEALQLTQSSKDPFLKAIFDSDTTSKNSFKNTFTKEAKSLLNLTRRGLPILDTAITLAPLLGLLGTVLGLINAFSSMGTNQITAPIAITGGISEALLATAFGLGVAILCLIPFNYFSELEIKVKEDLEDLGSAVEEAIN
jgi:biopolymer transport protein ExbB